MADDKVRLWVALQPRTLGKLSEIAEKEGLPLASAIEVAITKFYEAWKENLS